MIGNTIKTIRTINKINQYELAIKCNITPSYLNLIENNKRTPSIKILHELANNLNIPISIIMFLSFKKDEVRFKEEYEKLEPIIEKLLVNIIKRNIK